MQNQGTTSESAASATDAISSTTLTLRIENFANGFGAPTQAPEESPQLCGEPATFAGLQWRMAASWRPACGKSGSIGGTAKEATDTAKTLSVFVSCDGDANDDAWQCAVRLTLRVCAQADGCAPYEYKHTEWIRCDSELECGDFSKFISYADLVDESHGLLVNDTVILAADIEMNAALAELTAIKVAHGAKIAAKTEKIIKDLKKEQRDLREKLSQSEIAKSIASAKSKRLQTELETLSACQSANAASPANAEDKQPLRSPYTMVISSANNINASAVGDATVRAVVDAIANAVHDEATSGVNMNTVARAIVSAVEDATASTVSDVTDAVMSASSNAIEGVAVGELSAQAQVETLKREIEMLTSKNGALRNDVAKAENLIAKMLCADARETKILGRILRRKRAILKHLDVEGTTRNGRRSGGQSTDFT